MKFATAEFNSQLLNHIFILVGQLSYPLYLTTSMHFNKHIKHNSVNNYWCKKLFERKLYKKINHTSYVQSKTNDIPDN